MAANSKPVARKVSKGESDVRWLNPREMKAWRSYIIATRGMIEALEADLCNHDLSMPDYEVLALLSEAPERQMRMSDLATQAMVSKSRLSHRMKVMEKAGWVERKSCETDRRGSWACMTDLGWDAIRAAAPDHLNSIRRRFVDHLTSKDQEEIAKIFERVQVELRNQYIAEAK
jgi:DNA-binding MarR family transcriptional regulator